MRKRLAVAATAVLGLALAAPAQAGEPIMKLRDVRPGAVCTGLSVVRGTAISSFDVRILDVIVGDSDHGGPRLLVRVSGPAIAATGIGPGFSGSPIYCRDSRGVRRNAGAISEGLGDYGNFVALATPIEEILTERPAPLGSTVRRDPELRRSARPLIGPLTVGGLTGRPRRLLRKLARRAGIAVLSAPSGPLGGYPVQSLRPGASVAVSIADGDLSLGSVGTVAYRDGSAVWAFGHSLEGAGRRALFLQDAYVFTVIGNPVAIPDLGAGTYKLATAGGHSLGAVTNDADAAVVGQVGPLPASIRLDASARDLGTGRRAFNSTRLADERPLGLLSGIGLVAPLALGQSLDRILRSQVPLTLRMCIRFKIRERAKRFGFCNPYFNTEEALAELSEVTDLVDAYDFTPLGLTHVSARAKFTRGIKEDILVRARTRRRVRPGQRIRVRLRVRRRRGDSRVLRLRVRIPRSLRPGERTLVLEGASGAETDEELLLLELEPDLVDLFGEEEFDEERPEPRSVEELIAEVASHRRKLGITARYRRRGARRLVLKSSKVLFSGRVRVPLRVVRAR